MKKFFPLSAFLCCVLVAGVFTACDSPYKQKEVEFSKVGDVDSPAIRVGLPQGAKAMHVGEAELKNARLCYFNSHHAAYAALLHQEIDAYLFDSHTLDYVAANRPEFMVLPGAMGIVDIAIGVTPGKAELLEPVNAFIDAYKANGTYDEMYTRWVKLDCKEPGVYTAPEVPDMPQIDQPAAPTRKLVVGICSQLEPMCFLKDPHNRQSELTGFDIELLQRLALHLNAKFELRDLDYVSMMDKLAKGELDLVVAGLNKTPEREKRILFSKNYIDSNIVALVRSSQVRKAK